MQHSRDPRAPRRAAPIVQFIKYALCGGAATAVSIVCFYLLSWRLLPALRETDPVAAWLGLPATPLPDAVRARNAMLNNIGAFLVANLAAYLLNIAWVFQAGRRYGPVDRALAALNLQSRPGLCRAAHRTAEVAMFYAVSAVAVVAGTALMGVLIRQLGVETTAAFAVQCVLSVLINYVMRKCVIFKG